MGLVVIPLLTQIAFNSLVLLNNLYFSFFDRKCDITTIRIDVYVMSKRINSRTGVKCDFAVETCRERKWSRRDAGATCWRENKLRHSTAAVGGGGGGSSAELCVQHLPTEPRDLARPRAPARYIDVRPLLTICARLK